MKRYILRTLLALMITAIIFSCKKDNAKDYTASVADKTWWGKVTYTGKHSQYYAIQFNANGSFTWSEMSADSTGQWVVDGKHLTCTFSISKRQIKADISGDGKLFNIENNSAKGYTIDKGELIAKPNTSSLDNTLWKGAYTTGSGIGMVSAVSFRFLPASKVQYEWTSNTEVPNSYTRSASGVVVRGGGYHSYSFGVVISETEMKGTDTPNYYDWQLTKNP